MSQRRFHCCFRVAHVVGEEEEGRGRQGKGLRGRYDTKGKRGRGRYRKGKGLRGKGKAGKCKEGERVKSRKEACDEEDVGSHWVGKGGKDTEKEREG